MVKYVRIQPSGQQFPVEPGESVLAAALRHGVRLPYGCRDGTCGACTGELRSGELRYPGGTPSALTRMAAEAGRAILCQAEPSTDCDIEVREIERADEISIRTLPARVVERETLAHDVERLVLRLPAAERLRFLAGQYIDLLLRDGRRRSYSLANPPHIDDRLEIHVRQVPGGRFSDALLATVAPKTLLRLEGPLGAFYLRESSARPIIMVAGGTGFAPIKSMIEHALARGLERPIHLFWGVRARRDLYLAELAEGWAAEHGLIRFTPVLSEPEAGDAWDGATGWVHEAVLAAHPDLSDQEVYMAGPPGMIEAARRDFAAAGLPPEALFFDSFDYAPDALEALEGGPSGSG